MSDGVANVVTEIAMPVEYRSARWHSCMLLGFATLWLWAGVILLDDEAWMPILAFTIAAVSLYIGATNLLRPAIVRLDGDGVRFSHWCIAWFVAWTDIADVRLFTVRINGFKTTTNVIVRERNGAERRISPGLTITQTRLAELIRLRCEMT